MLGYTFCTALRCAVLCNAFSTLMPPPALTCPFHPPCLAFLYLSGYLLLCGAVMVMGSPHPRLEGQVSMSPPTPPPAARARPLALLPPGVMKPSMSYLAQASSSTSLLCPLSP